MLLLCWYIIIIKSLEMISDERTDRAKQLISKSLIFTTKIFFKY